MVSAYGWHKWNRGGPCRVFDVVCGCPGQVLKRSFANALNRQKGKYERELVAMLPSLEPGAIAAGMTSRAAESSASGALEGAPATNPRTRGHGLYDTGISDEASLGRLLLSHPRPLHRPCSLFGINACMLAACSVVSGASTPVHAPSSAGGGGGGEEDDDGEDTEDAPLISAVLTSLQQQVATLSQDIAVLRDTNTQLRCVTSHCFSWSALYPIASQLVACLSQSVCVAVVLLG